MDNLRVDALVVGGGIAGMQSALDLADQGFQVALVESEPSIGGKMITLSKVFPTLDCCSCITTPKMSAVAHHPNIHLLTYCEVQSVQEHGHGFNVAVLKKPRYVDVSKCTGCRECEYDARSPCPAHSTGTWARTAPSACRSQQLCRRKQCWILNIACGAANVNKPARSRQLTSPNSPRHSISKPNPSSWPPASI